MRLNSLNFLIIIQAGTRLRQKNKRKNRSVIVRPGLSEPEQRAGVGVGNLCYLVNRQSVNLSCTLSH